jgi:hypothetical protein
MSAVIHGSARRPAGTFQDVPHGAGSQQSGRSGTRPAGTCRRRLLRVLLVTLAPTRREA